VPLHRSFILISSNIQYNAEFLGSLKVKVKLSLLLIKRYAMNTWGNGVIAPSFLGTRWMWVVSFTLRPLYPWGNRPRYTLDRRLGGPQSRSGRYGEYKNLISSAGYRTLAVHSVARRYTDWPIRTPVCKRTDVINCAEFSVCVLVSIYNKDRNLARTWYWYIQFASLKNMVDLYATALPFRTRQVMSGTPLRLAKSSEP
jgi:hypothetical protein